MTFICLWVGLTVSLIKFKGLGIEADTSVLVSISVEGGEINLKEFQYLGSIISSDGELYGELSGWLSKAAKMFGNLH